METVNYKLYRGQHSFGAGNRRLLLFALLFLLAQFYLTVHDSQHAGGEHEESGCEVCLVANGLDLADPPTTFDATLHALTPTLLVLPVDVFSLLAFYNYLTRAPPYLHSSI